MTALILDTEAHDLNAPCATEVAYMSCYLQNLEDKLPIFCQRYNPLNPISLGAMAVTGICDEDVADCPAHTTFRLPANTDYIIGHNIDFDAKVLVNAGVDISNIKFICTLAMSRSLLPDLSSHELVALLYHIDKPYAREHARNAHSAMHDVIFTQKVLNGLVTMAAGLYGDKMYDIETLYQFSEYARVPKTMPFGKHKGVAIAELPKDYVKWAVANLTDMDKYLRGALENRLT